MKEIVSEMFIVGTLAKSPKTGNAEKVISVRGFRIELASGTFNVKKILKGTKDSAAIRVITSK